MNHQWIAKLGLLIMWPSLALLLLALMTLALAIAWFMIPFGTIKRKDDGKGYTMTFPWGD